jgi:hypothetical protein
MPRWLWYVIAILVVLVLIWFVATHFTFGVH